MYFYHRRTQSVCAGMTLALCTSGDFCHQMFSESGNPDQDNLVSGNSAQTSPPPSILDEVTPVPGYPKEDIPESDGRIQRTLLAGTRPPNSLEPVKVFSHQFLTGPVDHTDVQMVKAFGNYKQRQPWSFLKRGGGGKIFTSSIYFAYVIILHPSVDL